MPDLLIRLTRKPDGTAAFACVRPDGTVTWQRQQGVRAGFFPIHDLTHYAVETELGHDRGFYGLVAEGWDLTDFGSPWPRGPMPADMDPSELIVGMLDMERASGVEMDAAEFNQAMALKQPGVPTLSPDALARVRARCQELFHRWVSLPVGATLELPFTRRASL